jgi:hypothetical protein
MIGVPQSTPSTLDVIAAAAVALPPPQRAAFCRLVTSELARPAGSGAWAWHLYRVIAACQKTFLDAGLTAVEVRAKYSKHDAKAK